LVSSDVCDLILHHARKGVTASHYDFSTLEGPVRKALQDWAKEAAERAQEIVSKDVLQGVSAVSRMILIADDELHTVTELPF
jgi:hypothetical protein